MKSLSSDSGRRTVAPANPTTALPVLPNHAHHFVIADVSVQWRPMVDELCEVDQSHHRRPPWNAPYSNRDQPSTLGDRTIADITPPPASSSLCQAAPDLPPHTVFFSLSLFRCCRDHPRQAPS